MFCLTCCKRGTGYLMDDRFWRCIYMNANIKEIFCFTIWCRRVYVVHLSGSKCFEANPFMFSLIHNTRSKTLLEYNLELKVKYSGSEKIIQI